MTKHQPVTVLLVEDDPGHAVLIEKNLRRAAIANEIIILDDGHKAADFLLREGAYQGAPRPMPLLDLNLPVLDGYQVLELIKKDERTGPIPVVILTTTDNSCKVDRRYGSGCNIYVSKPVENDWFSEAIRTICLLLSIVKVPESLNASAEAAATRIRSRAAAGPSRILRKRLQLTMTSGGTVRHMRRYRRKMPKERKEETAS